MNKRKEKISAFLDNDMHRDELMSFSLSAESDDAKIAQRYQMLGDALRGEISNSSFVDVSQAVREALLDDNVFDEISTIKTATTSDKSSIFSAWLRPVAGMAVAVTVAVVMVVTLSGQETALQSPVAVNLETLPVAGEATRIASGATVDDKTTMQKTVASKMAGNNVINIDQNLINKHLEFATQDTLQGRLPYVRAVSFEPKE